MTAEAADIADNVALTRSRLVAYFASWPLRSDDLCTWSNRHSRWFVDSCCKIIVRERSARCTGCPAILIDVTVWWRDVREIFYLVCMLSNWCAGRYWPQQHFGHTRKSQSANLFMRKSRGIPSTAFYTLHTQSSTHTLYVNIIIWTYAMHL